MMNQKLDRTSGLALILLAVYVIIHTLVTLPLGSYPEGMAVMPDGSYVYVVCGEKVLVIGSSE